MKYWPALTSSLLLAGCSPTGGASADAAPAPRGPLLQGLTDEVFLPNYEEFELKSKRLDDLVGALCRAPTTKSLSAARTAWSSARAPWKRSEFLAFGPFANAPLRVGPKVDTWPARTEDIDEQLAGSEAVGAAAVANLGSTRRGMPVIEYLLYEVEGETATVFATDSRRCDYLRGLTADLATQASLMREAWDPSGGNYAAELAHAGEADTSGEFASVDLALQEVVNRLVFLTENIRSSKLGMPLGNRSGGFPLPDSAESRFSGRSLQDISDNLDGLESVVFGSGANGATSIVDYLEAGGDKELTEPLRAAFAQSRTALGLIAEPLVESVSGDADDIEAAISALGELQTLLQVDLIAALDLTLTFNDADGD